MAAAIEHSTLGTVTEFSQLRTDLQQQLVDFVDKGILNMEADGGIIEAVLMNDIEVAIAAKPKSATEFFRLAKVITEAVPMVARGSKVNIQAYMRSRRDLRGRL